MADVPIRVRATNDTEEAFDDARDALLALQRDAERAASGTDRLTEASRRTGDEATRTGDRVKSLGQIAQQAIGVGFGITAANAVEKLRQEFVAGLDRAVQLGVGLARVGVTMGLAKAEADGLRTELGQLHKTAGSGLYSLEATSGAFQSIQAEGHGVAGTLGIVESALNLAASTGEDLRSTTTGLNDVLDVFDLQAEHAARVSDALYIAWRETGTAAPTLIADIKETGATLQGLGVALEEQIALYAVLEDASAGSARSIITSYAQMGDANSELSRALTQLGVDARDAEGSLRPLPEIMDDLRERGLSTADIMVIFGAKSTAAIDAIINRGDEIEDVFNNIESSAGAAAEASSRLADEDSIKIQRLKEGWSEFWTGVGQLAVDTYDSMSAVGGIFLNEFNELVGSSNQQMVLRSKELRQVGEDTNAYMSALGDEFRRLQSAEDRLIPTVDGAARALARQGGVTREKAQSTADFVRQLASAGFEESKMAAIVTDTTAKIEQQADGTVVLTDATGELVAAYRAEGDVLLDVTEAYKGELVQMEARKKALKEVTDATDLWRQAEKRLTDQQISRQLIDPSGNVKNLNLGGGWRAITHAGGTFTLHNPNVQGGENFYGKSREEAARIMGLSLDQFDAAVKKAIQALLDQKKDGGGSSPAEKGIGSMQGNGRWAEVVARMSDGLVRVSSASHDDWKTGFMAPRALEAAISGFLGTNSRGGLQTMVEKAGLKYFAQGGMTTGLTAAILGDNPSGREAVLPLDSPRTVDALAQALSRAGQGQSINIGTLIVQDGREFERNLSAWGFKRRMLG